MTFFEASEVNEDMNGYEVQHCNWYYGSSRLSKLKHNLIGVIGLVENMPDGNAQRPGDVVKSIPRQTIVEYRC